jgi:high-affinity Fe2+/Pb2+ permease
MLIVSIPLFGLMLWGWWHNRQVDKYEEWKKQQEQEQGSVPSA